MRGQRGYVWYRVIESRLHASSKYPANSLPLSVWSAGMGARERYFERKSAAEALEWFLYVPAKAKRVSVSIAVMMYRLSPSTKRTTVSTSTTHAPLGRRIFFRLCRICSMTLPVRADTDICANAGSSLRRLRSVMVLPAYDSETPRMTAIFFLPIL